jgi:hypothetical protein
MKKESQFITEAPFDMGSSKTASLAGFTRLLIYFSTSLQNRFTLQYLDLYKTDEAEAKINYA